MSPSRVSDVRVLQLGVIDHAKVEFESLSELAEVEQVTTGTRESFLKDCKAGVYDGVKAIARTFDSVKITGRFDPELVSALPSSVKFLSHNGAGYDQIDVAACTKRGISVSNTPSAVDDATANTAIFLMLGALRRAWVPLSSVRGGQWRGASGLGHDPEGKVLGILGMGGIGTAVARRAAGFGLRVQYHNRKPVADLEKAFPEGGLPTYVGFEELLRTSDILSIHAPLNEKTRGLIGNAEFEMMKKSVIIVNTARGAVIDETALVEALESDRVWSAGLDVYTDEPEIHPGLLKSDKVVLLPHIGTATIETQKKMEVLVIDNVKSALQHDKLLTQVAEQK